MRETTVARNYAEALVALARRANDLEGWGQMIDEVAQAVAGDPRLLRFLETPRVSAERKNEIIAKAFADRLPRLFVRFLEAVITHRRQHLIPEIAIEYHALVDVIEAQLSRVLGKRVLPHIRVRPEILGGVVVRVGDTVMDGSVRRRLSSLRVRMLGHLA
jgi:F-type H+-transporting ATPase subunit delta